MLSPAKVNLFLAVQGRRADGFHSLLSLAVPLDFGDELTAEAADGFSLESDCSLLAKDENNLILKAARLFVRESGWRGGARFRLKKRIPMGAGLGGGSSNGAIALHLLSTLSGIRLPKEAMHAMAAELGSDCAMFLYGCPLVMRGRGEQIEFLPERILRKLEGRRLLLFKPDFGVETAWAYGQMIRDHEQGRRVYVSAEEAETRLQAWLSGKVPLESFIFNNMERSVFRKYVLLPVLLNALRKRFGTACGMSGSGSACFALLPEGETPEKIRDMKALIREYLGRHSFLAEGRILSTAS